MNVSGIGWEGIKPGKDNGKRLRGSYLRWPSGNKEQAGCSGVITVPMYRNTYCGDDIIIEWTM